MIGVFDSGIGGLTVVKALLERIPEQFKKTARMTLRQRVDLECIKVT